ncbi:MAG: PAS domain S-box protein, partial [bacterium]|nr:PAS domain S-box protein [bacterium]
ITERKKGEQELRESEERFKSLHNASFGGIAIHDKGLVLECNQGLSDITGYSREELLGKDGLLLFHKDSRDQVMNNILSGHEKPYEVTGLRKNGETYPLRLEGRGIPYKGKSVRAVEFRDITESKRAENLQRALYQISDSAIGCRDLQQLYLQVHKTIAKLMPAENLYIALYDEKTEIISFPYYKDQKNDNTASRKFGKGLTEHIITSQKPLLVNKEVHDRLQKEGRAEFMGQPSKQWLGVPLQFDSKTFGTLVIQSYDEKAEYTQRDLELLSFVGGNVAVAIHSIKSEQELAESESRYKTFMDSATDISFLKDDQLRYLMVNKAQEEFFGKPAGLILGKTDYELMPPEAAQSCRLSDQMVLESKQTMLSHEQTGNRVYEARKFPVELQNSKTGVGAYIRDITEQQRADRAIRESQEKYRDLVENINDVVFAVDIHGKLMYISPSVEQVFGYRPDEIIGRNFIDFVDEADRPLLAREMQSHSQGGVAPGEYRITTKNGVTKWISSSSRLIMEDGKPVGLNGLMTDITERRQAGEQIRLAAKKWETTFDSIGDGICLLDRQWKILQCNQSFINMVGRPYAEVLGRSCHDLFYGTDQTLEKSPLTRMEHSLHHETQELERAGRFLLAKADPIIDHQKALAGAVYTVTDITDRKLLEQELLQAQKMEAVGFLAGGVAHDFNNMLAGIVGNAELLQLKIYGQKELESYLDNIIKASGHAAGLTKQLLAFARKGQYQQVPVNVHKVIAETLGILGNTIDRRIKIEQHLRANPAVILGDHSQLENALMNLGINARDAMPQGGKLIFSTDLINLDKEYILQRNYKVEPGHYIQISVDDTGSGMSEEVKRHLFEPFFTTKEKGRGTGLGLAGVYGCIKNHGGSVEVYSEPGRGTAIKLYLPLYADLTAAGEPDFVQLKEMAVTAGTGSILIVDDEDMIRTIAAQILKTAGYQVQTCADGQEAVDLYARDHGNIDLVIMDMVMPRLDGREAFNQMRKIEPRVKMLLSSGFSEDGDAQAILEDGALGFIQKPYRSAELLLRVQQALQLTKNN